MRRPRRTDRPYEAARPSCSRRSPAVAILALGVLCWLTLGSTAMATPEPPRLASADNDRHGAAGFLLAMLEDLIGPKELGRDFAYLIAPRTGFVLGTGLVLGAAAFYSDLDDSAVTFFRRREIFGGFTDTVDTVGNGRFLYPTYVGSYVLGRVAKSARTQLLAAQLTQAQLVTDILVHAGKFSTRRRRPDGSDRRSLPSGHTANFFSAATVLQANFGARAGVPAYALATVVAVTRLDGDQHFVSDVLIGAAVGIAVGHAVTHQFTDRADRAPTHTQIRIAPTAGNRPGLTVTIRF